jgi:hypothetical protein
VQTTIVLFRKLTVFEIPTIVSFQRIVPRIQTELEHIAQRSRYRVALSIWSSPDHDVRNLGTLETPQGSMP